jgi:hypothetical protein
MSSIKYSVVQQYESINTYWTWLFFLPHYEINFLEVIREPLKSYHFYASFETSLELRIYRIRSNGHEVLLCMCGAEIRWRLKSCGMLGCDATNKCRLEAADCSKNVGIFLPHYTASLSAVGTPNFACFCFFYFLKFNNQLLYFNKEACRSLIMSYVEFLMKRYVEILTKRYVEV